MASRDMKGITLPFPELIFRTTHGTAESAHIYSKSRNWTRGRAQPPTPTPARPGLMTPDDIFLTGQITELFAPTVHDPQPSNPIPNVRQDALNSNATSSPELSSAPSDQRDRPAPLLQFNWDDARNFDDIAPGFDFLPHSDDVNVQLQHLMTMSFLSPIGASPRSPVSRQQLAGSDLSIQTLTSNDGTSPPKSTIWGTLDKERWTTQIEQVQDAEQVFCL
jgi:hypothetical protein